MKSLLLITASIFALSATAQAHKYECNAKANPDRGYPVAFSVVIEPAEVGGTITFKIGNASRVIGEVTETASIDRSHPAFGETIGLIGEVDVSGLTREEEVNIHSIVNLRGESPKGQEIAIFQILDKSGRQIGGTFSVELNATACF